MLDLWNGPMMFFLSQIHPISFLLNVATVLVVVNTQINSIHRGCIKNFRYLRLECKLRGIGLCYHWLQANKINSY